MTSLGFIMKKLKAFILSKNEEANIRRCIESLKPLDIDIIVLDSGSTDKTCDIANSYPFVVVENYTYINHLIAYNQICLKRTKNSEYCIILDSDMIVSEGLRKEIVETINLSGHAIIAAPIKMHWCGHEIRYGSLYPAKPFLFKGGGSYFEASGHGEKVIPRYRIYMTINPIIHDDRKSFCAYLESQIRYARNFMERAKENNITFKDRIRLKTPIMILATPCWSFFIRLGIISGKAGLLYALDRLLAEAIIYRQALAKSIEHSR
jgi:glycosyltransferase involved in cell wall biosynthesis